MDIECITAGPFETNGYLLSDETKKAVIIDTPLESTHEFMLKIRQKGLTVEAIILTHTHWDHTADAAELKRQTGAKLYVHTEDAYRLEDPKKFSIMRLPFIIEAVEADVLLKGGELIEFGNQTLEVKYTPGHTEGGICLVNHDQKIIFSGDTLFAHSIGRCDLPGGSMPQLINSINDNLLSLEDDYTIYCGHGENTSVGIEKRTNPILNS